MANMGPHNTAKTVSLALDRVQIPIDDTTYRVYYHIVRRLAEGGADGPPSGLAQKTYDQYVSALTYVAGHLVERLWERVESCDRQFTASELELIAASERILQAYEPSGELRAVAEPHHGRVGPNPDRPKRNAAPTEGAYRAAAARMRRSPRYRDNGFFRVSRDHTVAPDAIALCLITGVRNRELANGVTVREPPYWRGTIEIGISGAKVSPAHGRGIPHRTLIFDPPCDPDTPLGYLASRLAVEGPHTVCIGEGSLRSAVTQAAFATFRTPLANRITPYVLRHLAAGRLRKRTDKRTVMRALGHQGQRSLYAYYNGDDAGPLPLAVYAQELEPGLDFDPVGPAL
ncbi:site-specific integrase [Rhodovibrio salinarum]|uniref:Phage integrase family protein n=1 Tax=Rhodovibrio salinarum TaxID=1087 RepID=A0A934QIG1_9PROT|nr:site-specific integrase [Rhodovibrio salinarum]MBK1697160.1 hypothetical protein [Rhodovibrio salinarum]